MKSMLFTIVSLSAACLSTLPSEAHDASYQKVSKIKKSDPTLRFISADEPFVQPGAPPFPRSFDFANHPTRFHSNGVVGTCYCLGPASAKTGVSHTLPTTHGTAMPARNETSDAFEKASPSIHF